MIDTATTVDKRYLGLRIFAALHIVLGFLLMVPGIIVIIITLSDGFPRDNRALIVLAVAVLFFLLGLPFIAIGELMNVIIAIERGVRQTSCNTSDMHGCLIDIERGVRNTAQNTREMERLTSNEPVRQAILG